MAPSDSTRAGPVRRRWALVLMLTALAGLILAACGGKEAEAPAPTAPPTPADHLALAGLQRGAAAPAFRLPAADGAEVALADYAGEQPVLLFFHMAEG